MARKAPVPPPTAPKPPAPPCICRGFFADPRCPVNHIRTAASHALPCPFCGGAPQWNDRHPDQVQCSNIDCGILGPMADPDNSPENAWNRRRLPAPIRELHAALYRLEKAMGSASSLLRAAHGVGWLGLLAEAHAEQVAERQKEAARG